ncbi:MAG: hypothetical protein CR967_04405 [Proteobacteria bacterium]|nr:MAG: hypothetical protein CR967_04405 [Pseudomonadota bacterium]
MNVSINLTNVDDIFLKALKSFFKVRPDIGVKIKKEKMSDFEADILRELKETKEAYKRGEIKGYTSAKEMMDDLRYELQDS